MTPIDRRRFLQGTEDEVVRSDGDGPVRSLAVRAAGQPGVASRRRRHHAQEYERTEQDLHRPRCRRVGVNR